MLSLFYAACLLTALLAYREERRHAAHLKEMNRNLLQSVHEHSIHASVHERQSKEWQKVAVECRQIRIRLLEELSECRKQLGEKK